MDLDQVEEKKEEVIESADTDIMDSKDNEEDIQVKKDEIIKAQAKQIKDQEKELLTLKENQKEILQALDRSKGKHIKVSNKPKPIPPHLSPVQNKHLKDLEGLKMKFDGNPGGDCLSSCTTMHISHTKDSFERKRMNKRINNHIADNYDNFYVNKISLPYRETVGVGSKAREVCCNTREELLQFLRSEDSLCTYSNYQELLAICNLLNIKIHVFSYGIGGDNTRWSWSTVFPDPEMSKSSEFDQGIVPDMLLYNSDNTHYDLLVPDNSRLAVLGFISMGEDKEIKVTEDKKVQEKEAQKVGSQEGQWKTMKGFNKPKNVVESSEKKQTEADSDEVVMTKNKQNGHKRDGPHSSPLRHKEGEVTVNLAANMEKLKVSDLKCDKCQEKFEERGELIRHIKNRHSLQWNCDQCSFQANTRAVLMNHCKQTQGHLPSNQKQRVGQTGVLECYTCKGEFRSYHNLMKHRKEEHPSHKKCRYYLKGECAFSSEECWYLHEDKVDSDNHVSNTATEFQCFVCNNIFISKYDLMKHKRENHPSKIPCTKFQIGACDRSSENCNYDHKLPTTEIKRTSPIPNAWSQPLHKVQEQDFYQTPPREAPDQVTLVRALNMLNQRLQSMEERMFSKLI